MGVAVLSGVLDNLRAPNAPESHEEDSMPTTPMGSMILDAKPESLPDRSARSIFSSFVAFKREQALKTLFSTNLLCRFIATVNRAESARKLRRNFSELGSLGAAVQVRQSSENVKSVAESDVVLLW